MNDVSFSETLMSELVWLTTVLACGWLRCANVVVFCRIGSRLVPVFLPVRLSTQLGRSHTRFVASTTAARITKGGAPIATARV